MIGKLASAVIGRGFARRTRGKGLLGAAAGFGVSILLRRIAPIAAVAAARQARRLVTRTRSVRDHDTDTQSAGA